MSIAFADFSKLQTLFYKAVLFCRKSVIPQVTVHRVKKIPLTAGFCTVVRGFLANIMSAFNYLIEEKFFLFRSVKHNHGFYLIKCSALSDK